MNSALEIGFIKKKIAQPKVKCTFLRSLPIADEMKWKGGGKRRFSKF